MTSPWRTLAWAAKYLCFTDTGEPEGRPDRKRFHAYMTKYIPRELRRKVGRSVLIHIDALEPNLNERASRLGWHEYQRHVRDHERNNSGEILRGKRARLFMEQE